MPGTIEEQMYVGDDSDDMSIQENLQHEAGQSEDEFDVSHIYNI